MKTKVLKLTQEAFNYYRENTNERNKNITYDQACKKISRNVLLAKEVKLRDKFQRLTGMKLYHYGNLHIYLRWNRVIKLVNHKGGKHYGGWQQDIMKHIELSEQLGIEDNKYSKQLNFN